MLPMGLSLMLNVDYLYVLSALLEVGEPDEAKKAAARLLDEDMSHIADLWTIHRCADILDNSIKLANGKARLGKFARELGDPHRAAIVEFCQDNTGNRSRRSTVAVPEPQYPLSVYQDTQPGYDERDAQPAGLSVHRAPWEAHRDHDADQLTRQLRTAKKQLPAHMRTEMRAVKSTDETRCRPPKSEAQEAAERRVDEYIRTRLGKEDRTAHGMSTIFDVDDDNHRFVVAPRVMAATIARVRKEMKARTTATDGIAEAVAFQTATDQEPTTEAPDTPSDRNTEIHDPLNNPAAPLPGYEFDYARAALHPIRTTPCVVCWTERRPQDVRTIAHANGYDDSLCGQCRSDGHTGLPKPRPVRILRTVAYLNPADRAQATADAARTAVSLAPCITAAATLPKGAALVWLRAYRALASETERPTIDRWVLAWLDSAQPQPPTTPAPAAPARVLVAA